jgi:hypothetical protein
MITSPSESSQTTVATDTDKAVLHMMRSGALREAAVRLFQSHDVAHAGYLEWNNGGIRNLITDVFRTMSLNMPTEQQMYAMYSRFDAQGAWRLDLFDCTRLVEMLVYAVYGLLDAENQRAALVLKRGELAAVAEKLFSMRDFFARGFLLWASGELRSVVIGSFKAVGLEIPADYRIEAMYRKFDFDKSKGISKGYLDYSGCWRIIETLCQERYHIQMDDPNATCPQGHGMQLFSTPTPDYVCNVCRLKFPKSVALWGCRACDFDMCVQCSKSRRHIEKGAALCPVGHDMKLFSTPKPDFSCDACLGRFAAGTALWGCRKCDFDVCVRCAGKSQVGIQAGMSVSIGAQGGSSISIAAQGGASMSIPAQGGASVSFPAQGGASLSIAAQGGASVATIPAGSVAVRAASMSVAAAPGSPSFVMQQVAAPTGPQCNKKHPMQLVFAFAQVAKGLDYTFTCDSCGEVIPKYTLMWSCRPCGFDVCRRCAMKGTLAAKEGDSQLFSPPKRQPIEVEVVHNRQLIEVEVETVS